MPAPTSNVPWNKAAFLHERVPPDPSQAPTPGPAALQRAEQRARDWRKGMLVDDDAVLEERIRLAGLDRQAFLRLLAQDGVGGVAWSDGGEWLKTLEEILDRRHAGQPLPELTLPAPQPGKEPQVPLFTGFLRPFLEVGAARLRAGVSRIVAQRAIRDSLLSREAEQELLKSLGARLQTHAIRALALELNVARMLEKLPAGTPADRFRHFSTTYFEDPEVVNRLLQKQPVLARLLVTTLDRWTRVSLELLDRIAADRPEIARTFAGGAEVGELSLLRTGISDLHRGGRSVVQLKFASGLMLVYKPKSLAVDEKFQRLLRWLAGKGLSTPHRTLQLLDRGDYGWVEFVEAEGCERREQIARFYFRQGSYLALLHALKAVDFHLENLIAAGEHPVLVDLEALFHHDLPFPAKAGAMEHALDVLRRSILSTGLLPVMPAGSAAAIDMSGLGGEPGQLFPRLLPALDDVSTDTMRVVRRKVAIQGASNRPRLGGEPADPTQFVEQMVEGFQDTYRLLLRHRDELAVLLRELEDVEVRQILRPTQRYGFFLSEGNHPDYLHDGLERDRILDKLWSETGLRPVLRRLIAFELADLRLGDIPMFTTRPGQRHIWASTGERIDDFFEASGLGAALEGLARMSEADCALQCSFLRKSLISIEKEREVPAAGGARREDGLPAGPAAPGDFLAAAVSLGEQLQAAAIHGPDDVAWIGVSVADLERWRWTLSPIQTSLHEGVGGLALFFGYLAAATGRQDFKDLARKALQPVLRQLEGAPVVDFPGVGAFLGKASHLYVLGHLSMLWRDSALLDKALAALPALEEKIDADENLDILTGSAGCALVLLGLHRQTGDARFLRAAGRCGARLLSRAAERDGSVCWTVPVSSLPLGGFSHGVAGISWALLEIAAATGDERCRVAARRSLGYERSTFDEAHQNWRDVRLAAADPANVQEHYLSAWCNGAAGIALGRLLSLPHLDDAGMRSDIDVGLKTTLREGFGANHSLCHGDLGNADVLLLASEALKEPRLAEEARLRGKRVLAEGRRGGFRCGLPRNNETPGMMLGYAGIGMGLLRLWSPERVPSVLRLGDPPSAAWAPGAA